MSLIGTLWLATCFAGPAEGPPPVDTAHRAFRIPLDLPEARTSGYSAVRIYYSRDQGKTWNLHAEGSLKMENVTFRAEQEGEYWFVLALVNKNGSQIPDKLEEAEPGLKVHVDATRPKLTLKPVRNKAGRHGLRWECSDDRLDPSTFRLAVWGGETAGWKHQPVPARGNLIWFDEGTNYPRIQGTVRDRAGNAAVLEIHIEGNSFWKETPARFALADEPAPATAVAKKESEANPVTSAGADAARRGANDPTPLIAPTVVASENPIQQVAHLQPEASETMTADSPAVATPAAGKAILSKSRRVTVNYEVDAGAPTAGLVELWGTKDRGESWQKIAVDEDRASPIEAELPEEGSWGLRIVVARGEPGGSQPGPGMIPQLTVEVDSQPPTIELAQPRVEEGSVSIHWSALDKNLMANGVDIFAGPSPRGPWKRIGAKLEAQGDMAWDYRGDEATGSAYIRLLARDQAGNVATALSPRLLLPTAPESGRITQAEPKPETKQPQAGHE